MKRVWVIGMAIGALCLWLFVGTATAAYDADTPVDFTLHHLGGGSVSLSDYRGQWVVVNYWATWCAPCRKEMPELSELHEERNDVTVLGVAFESLGDADFDKFLQSSPVSYPILTVDVFHPPEPFGAPKVLPTTILLDPQGRAVKTFFGPVTKAAIERFVDDHASD